MNDHDATSIQRNKAPEPDTASALGRSLIALSDIKLAHSVFALPFAILGAFLVAPHKGDAPMHGIDWRRFSGMLLLIVVCMVCARTWAMLVNRFVDRQIDADNPRTAKRAFASGALSTRDGVLFLLLSALAFIGACALFGVFYSNWMPSILSIPVLLWIGFYSLTKRFTWLCHVFLGGALAASPIAAAIAVDAEMLAHTPAVLWIAGMVVCWVAGFDVIYALQDLEYDRAVGLNSIPARFGWKRAAWLSRALHTLAILCLLGAWNADDRLALVFLVGVLIVTLVLIYEHIMLAKRGSAGIPMAFFTLNGIVSIVLGVAGCADLMGF